MTVKKSFKLLKTKKVDQFDENTFAKSRDLKLFNGSIEVDVYSQLLEDAPDFARGFLGIAFRISENNDTFESFYVRPTNGPTKDPIRKNRAFQYFAYPNYDFAYFRERGITIYEGPADIDLKEWIKLKVVLRDSEAKCYINDKLVLEISPLIHQPNSENQGL